MIKVELKNGKWVNSKNEVIGELIQISGKNFAIKTLTGEEKPILMGWLDPTGKFYTICCLPYTVCISNCKLYNTKTCRYNITMGNAGYYVFD